MKNPPPTPPRQQVLVINQETANALLIRLFKALQNAFATDTDNGVVRAYELIEMLADTAEKDGEVFRTILTEENITAFMKLKQKGDAKGGHIGLTDLIQAFPAIGGAMKGGLLKNFLK